MSRDPFLDLSGAVADGSAVAHFGAPLAEQRALAEGNALVSLAHHGVVTVAGPDRLSWLHSMTSQQLTGLRPGESVETLLLDQQGRIEQAIRLVDDGERSWLLVDDGRAGALAEYLNRMRFALRVEVADVSSKYASVLAFNGGKALPELRALGLAVVEWVDPWSALSPGGVQYARGEHAGADWNAVQLVFRREHLPAVIALVGTSAGSAIRAAGTMALEALEVRAWRPTLHGEVDERAIPHEFDWLRTAVHLTKGCYRGQETIAKVHNLGHPPRRLTLLHLDGSGGQLPENGALVYLEGADADARPVGRITRSALHYEWGGIALALLKRSVPEDAMLSVVLAASDNGAVQAAGSAAGADGATASGERIAASQEVIVPSDAGRARDIPRLKRL